MAYQTFPWQQGDSDSFGKLSKLDIPNLQGKSFLDVGCNTGFFCGYAHFLGAERAIGIDKNPSSIAIAQALFPQCDFMCKDWYDLGSYQYDVITCLSAIHYADDQKKFLDFLMSKLKPGGTLVLEIGVAPGDEDDWVKVKRSIDTRLFPTQKKLESMFQGYIVKFIRRSVSQIGDPVPRWVYHISHKLPVAILLLDDPHAGKTSISKHIFKDEIMKISGDTFFYEIYTDQRTAPSEITAIIKNEKMHRNWGHVAWEICQSGLLPQLCQSIVADIGHNDFILDMFIPRSDRGKLCNILEEMGYYVVDVQLQKARSHPRMKEKAPTGSCKKYFEHLHQEFVIDEKEYLAANPDVARAVAVGSFPNGQTHYLYYGKKEGRMRAPQVQEDLSKPVEK